MKRSTRIMSWLTCLLLLLTLMPFAAFAGGGNTVIETVNLTDFVVPSVGDQAVNNPSCTIESGKGYTYRSSMFLYKNNQFTSTFQGAETYTVRFHLNAEDGYEFAPTGTLTATVNGGAVTVKSVTVGAQYRGSDSATVEAEFTMPDLREEVSEFVGTSNMGVITYGDDVKYSYDFSFTVGTQAYVSLTMGDWEKWNETTSAWEEYNEVKFTEGKYRYSNQLRIDDDNGKTHKLAATGTVTIDGAAWEYGEYAWIEPTYSYTYITSPEFTVEKAVIPLDFTDNNLYNIGINYIDTAITSYSVSGGVMGGTEPYVFSKTSGPQWVTVAADGTVSGTPTALGENSELVIRVTDADSNYKEITVYVGNTYCKPEDRITVSEFEATSNMPAIAFGTEVEDSYDFDFTVGAQAYITLTMGYWEKWNESLSAWEEYEEEIFTLGKYRYSNQLRIDGDNGKTHKLAETSTVTIDGAAWEYDDEYIWIEPTYSYTYITSPEFEVGSPEVVNQIKLNNVIIPAAGDSASTAPTCTVEGKADLSVAKYFYDNGEFDDVFESCKIYTIRFSLIAEAGYEFETAENLSVTVNGGAVAVKKISVGARYRKNDGATVEIEFNFHSPAFVSGKTSGCTTDGWKDYYDCVCGKHFEDAAGTTEITDLDAWKIGDGKIAAGHTYGTLIEAKPEVHTQSKLEASVAAHYFCDVCDTYFTEGKVATTLQALTGAVPSHNYANKYAYKIDDGHADTCSCGAHNAVVDHKYTNACDKDCNDCGKTRTPAAHQYDNACDKDCNICKAIRTPAAHQYDNACDKDCNICKATRTPTAHKGGTATCKEKAKCSVCGVSYGSLAGHKFGDYVYNDDATATKDGTKTRTCSVCKKTETVTAAGTKRTNPFKDVKLADYFCEPVLWAVEKEITIGINATHFAPANGCTRGQVVTFLWRAAGKPKAASETNPFVDVEKDAYYYDAVLWAVEKGITNGKDATHFGPASTCTRGEIVTFLYRAAGKPKVSSETNPFKDVKKGEYYYDAVLWAVEKGITNGKDATHFGPASTCTRGQVVTFLYRKENNK